MKDNCNLLGISGKAGSGKDTVGKIIQYLQYKQDQGTDISYKDYKIESLEYDNKWKIKKFAYKVKQILSILTGIPIEDFEKEEIKNSYLGLEWQRFRVVDKDLNRIEPIYLATYKEACELKERRLKSWPYLNLVVQPYSITVRQAMQLIGTDLFRDKFHPSTWGNALFSEYKSLPKEKSGHDKALGMYSCVCSICGSRFSSRNKYQTLCKKHWDETNLLPNWVITDLRFENEAQAILDRGGILIRVNRPIGKITYPFILDTHPSETALDNYDKFHYTSDNNGTIEELIVKVEEILINLKLIDEKKK